MRLSSSGTRIEDEANHRRFGLPIRSRCVRSKAALATLGNEVAQGDLIHELELYEEPAHSLHQCDDCPSRQERSAPSAGSH